MTMTLNIDMDAACPQCGKGGAVNHGICLTCVNKNLLKKMKGKTMVSGIGEKTIQEMKRQAEELIDTHKRSLQAAFLKAEDGKMKVGISIAIVQAGEKLIVESTITYTVEKVSDKQSAFIEENQPGLFAA
jgi:hypothetical protein